MCGEGRGSGSALCFMERGGRAKRRHRFGILRGGVEISHWVPNASVEKRRRRFALPAHSMVRSGFKLFSTNSFPLRIIRCREVNSPMKTSVTELPFNKFVGLQPATDPHVLSLPTGSHYLNHLGTVHASAQLALAEASSGEFLLRQFGSIAGIVPVVRRLDAKFRKPANGAIQSTVTTAPDAIERVRTDLAAKGRALVAVTVELHDESGAHTLSATVEWFVSRIE
jgi:hypothetical protein